MNTNLNTILCQVIKQNNCTIIPNLGAFITFYQAAVIDTDNKRILAPRTLIAFNQNLTANDDLLIDAIVEHQKIGYAQATAQINNYINTIVDTLDKDKIFDIQGIGSLYLDSENNILFKQRHNAPILQNSYGLIDVNISKLFETQTPTKKYINHNATQTLPIDLTNSLGKIATIAAASLLFGGIWIGIKHLENPTKPQKTNDKQQATLMPNNPINTDTTQPKTTNTKPTQTKTTQPNDIIETANYKIIVGTFGNIDNVNKVTIQLKTLGFDTEVQKVGKLKQLNQIAVGNYLTKEKADADLSKIKTLEANAWIKDLRANP